MSVRQDQVQVSVEINGKKAGETMKDLNNSAKLLNKELSSLAIGSDEFVRKSEELRQVNSRIAEVREEVRGVQKSVEQNAESLVKFSEGIAAAFTIAPLLTFTDESEELAKVQAKSLQALALAQNVKKIAEGAANAQTVISLGIDKAKLAGTQALTLAQRAYNAVLNANPIGLVVTAATALVAVFVTLYHKSEAFRKVIQDMFEPIKNLTAAAAEFFGLAETDAEKRIALLDKRKAKAEESYGKEIELMQASGAAQDAVLKKQIELTDKQIKLAQARLAAMKDASSEEIEAQKKVLNDLTFDRQKYSASLQKFEKDEAEKRAEEQRKRAEDERKAREAQLQKLVEQEKALQEKLKADTLAARKSIRDLNIALIKDDNEKQIATLKAAIQDKIDALVGTTEQIAEQTRLIYAQQDAAIAELEAARIKADAERAEERFMAKMEVQEEQDAIELEHLANKFLTGLQTEEQYQLSLFDLQKNSLQQRLLLMQEAGKGQTTEALKLANQIKQIEKDRTEYVKKQEEEQTKARQMSTQMSLDLATSYLNTIMAVYSQDEAMKKRNIRTLVAVQKAAILVDGFREVARYFAEYGYPAALAFSVPAAVRTGLAVAAVEKQQFYTGGYTGSGGKYDPAGVVHKGEWVANQELVNNPMTGPVIAWLEQMRTGPLRGYATGGIVGANPLPLPSGATGVSFDISAVVMQLAGLRQDFNQMQTNLRAYIVYSDIEDAQTEVNSVRELATVRVG